MSEDAPRIEPGVVRGQLESGSDTLLVCAYDDDAKCGKYGIEGAITLTELERREAAGEVEPGRELVFYCA